MKNAAFGSGLSHPHNYLTVQIYEFIFETAKEMSNNLRYFMLFPPFSGCRA
jgi:hypothetical protein